MGSDDVRNTVRKALREHAQLQVDIDTIADDDDLFARGMASLTSVNVMLALEDAFDIEFPDTMVQRSVFSSVDSLSIAVETLLGQTA